MSDQVLLRISFGIASLIFEGSTPNLMDMV